MGQTVVLTNSRGDDIGTEDVEAVHRGPAQLHRAFSIFVFDSAGRLLVQRRNQKKGFGGLWSNTCCGHPPPREELRKASKRRLYEEMGFRTDLREVDSFIYRATDARRGKTEFEYDHLLVGFFDGKPTVDADEVEAWRWIDLTSLLEDLHGHPGMFTPWFKLAVERLSRLGTDSNERSSESEDVHSWSPP